MIPGSPVFNCGRTGVLARWSTCIFFLFVLLFSTPAYALDLTDSFSGCYKALGAVTKSTSSKEDIYYALQRVRLEFEPKLTKNIELNLTYDHELILNDFSNTPDFDLIRQRDQKHSTWFDADQVISDTKHVNEKQLLHRAFIKFESDHSRLTFGKQLIDWGRMRFYSPLDLFNPPIPSNIEADERVGFDALNIEFSSDNFSGINLLYGPNTTEATSSYGLRFYKKIATYDTFLLAAKHEKDRIVGIGFDGYIKDAGFRGEFSYTRSGKEKYARVSIGADYSLSPKATVLMEYFYNGAANGDYDAFANSIFVQSQQLTLKKHLLSQMITYEITPLFKFRWLSIYDIVGKSAFLTPELRYNIKENLDIAVGSQLFIKSLGSEFQNSNNIYYAELKLFF